MNYLCKFNDLFKRKVILYGAGSIGVETYKVLKNNFTNVNIYCFCDSIKKGTMCDLKIIAPDELKAISEQEPVTVIITGMSVNHKEIEDNLKHIGIPDDYILTFSDFHDIIMHNIEDPHINNEWYRSLKRLKHTLPVDEKRNIYVHWWCPEHYLDNDILVYQPGKVASSSVLISLMAVNAMACNVHMLSDTFIYDLVPELSWEPDALELETIKKCSEICIDKIKNAKSIKIITLVREPISRDFSSFMFHVDELYESGYLSQDADLADACAEGILKRATQNGKCLYGYQFEWFNKEIKDILGLDVYNYPFDKNLGYSIIKQDNIEVLIIKLEKLNGLEHIISEFINVPDFKLINTNEASKRVSKDLYKTIRETVKIPHSVVSMYYEDNPYMNHFYSDEEKSAFLKKWRIEEKV